VKLKERHTKRQLPLEQVTIAEALKAVGYQTALLGKWHLGGAGYMPSDQGYDIYLDKQDLGYSRGYFKPPVEHNTENRERPYLTDDLGDEAVKLLRRYSRRPDTPFLLIMCFHTVHTPIQPKASLRKKYETKLKGHRDDRWDNSAYASMVQSMDENVGKILKALKTFHFEQNTVVIYTSDNGGLLKYDITSNDPLSLGKGYYHEGGIRVPAIIRGPGVIKTGSVCEFPIISMDYYPTILEMAGLPLMPEQHKDGLSLVPLLKGKPALARDAFYWHYPHYHGAGETPCSAIRCGDYKFIRHYEDNKRELYNIHRDPSETQNLIERMPAKAKELETKLGLWLTEMNAHIPKK
jgi:arylsulfatase A-like enzyme